MKRDKHTQKFSIEEILAVVYKTAGFCVCEILERIAKSDSSQLTVWLGGFEEVCSWKHFWILWEGHIIGRVWQFQAGFLTLRYTFHCGPVAALCEQRCTHLEWKLSTANFHPLNRHGRNWVQSRESNCMPLNYGRPSSHHRKGQCPAKSFGENDMKVCSQMGKHSISNSQARKWRDSIGYWHH